MTRHLTFPQLTLLVGIAVGVGIVLLALIYFFHRNVRRHSQKEEWKAPSPRTENSQAFVLATMQGVIAALREDQKKAQDLLREKELRAEQNASKVELLSQEIEEGLLIIDCERYITLANPAARALLKMDTWSRRRFPEILGAGSELALRIECCLVNGTEMHREEISGHNPLGETQRLSVTIVPLRRPATGGGEINGAICLMKKA